MTKFNIPAAAIAMLAATAARADEIPQLDPAFPDEAALAGGACDGGVCGCQCGNGKTPAPVLPVPIVVDNSKLSETNGFQEFALAMGKGIMPEGYVPYADPKADEACMGATVGTATIAAGATATINIEPTMGCFDGWYIQIVAVDNAAPNTRGRVEVARFFIGDCPRECRNANVFSDVYEGLTNGCCQGVPFRAKFGKTAQGEQLNVVVTNPTGGFANARVQIIIKGFCKKSPASCT